MEFHFNEEWEEKELDDTLLDAELISAVNK